MLLDEEPALEQYQYDDSDDHLQYDAPLLERNTQSLHVPFLQEDDEYGNDICDISGVIQDSIPIPILQEADDHGSEIV